MYRYIGNKTKLTHEILNDVKKIIGSKGTVADIMCGTASVSLALKNEGYNVIASDIMTYSYYHAIVNLLIDEQPDFAKLTQKESLLKSVPRELRYEAVIDLLNTLEPIEGYFFKEFSPEGKPANGEAPRMYFTSKNAKKIDSIIKKINEWDAENLINEKELALIKHDVILSVNPVANISGTYGHFHSNIVKSALDNFVLEPSYKQNLFSQQNNAGDHTVYKGYAEELASIIKADLCYIDPPYMKRQYAANYHILETIARGDEPEAAGVSGLRPWRDQYSNFCSKVKIRDSFRQIFSKMDCPNFLISYSEDGLLSADELIELFSEFGEVSLRKFTYKRFRSNKSKLKNEINEYLFWVRKKS
ncbi:DNA adenine methylase [Mesobacillus foraminis]|uniref:site-specific DNA-methyltransferase (adenine-specific) n=1 Tax=Mesobacillus foraminis TaxID=279826 RepID=A0A4R2B6Q6_9BACI|nr:DNA adenine methylase [Mesobacillus foraminis]TCN21079.1 adenine-specific DNA-methyltransferase [Mesobacillus foraminis]